MIEQLILKSCSGHVKDKVAGSPYGFVKRKSCEAKATPFQNEVAGWVDEGGALDVVYLHFSKALTVSPKQRYKPHQETSH